MRLEKKRKEWKEEKKLFSPLFHSPLRRTNINSTFESVILTFRCLFICHILEALTPRKPFHSPFAAFLCFLSSQSNSWCGLWTRKKGAEGEAISFLLASGRNFNLRWKRYQKVQSEKHRNSFHFSDFFRIFFFTPRPPLNFLSNHKARISILLIILNAKESFQPFVLFLSLLSCLN